MALQVLQVLGCVLLLSSSLQLCHGADTHINFYFSGMIPAAAPPAVPSVSPGATASPSASPTHEELVYDTPAVNWTEPADQMHTYPMNIAFEDIKPHVLPLIGMSEQDEHHSEKRDYFNGCVPPIKTYGGKVLTGNNYVYLIYYGYYSRYHQSSSAAAVKTTKSLLETFTQGLGAGTDWWNTNSEYYMEVVDNNGNKTKKYVAPTYAFGGTYSVTAPYNYAVWNSTYSMYSLSSYYMQQIIVDTVGVANIKDNAVYLFISSPDVCMNIHVPLHFFNVLPCL